ncbi:septation protein SpoVG family protein [candidate division TA06 bacterium]|uniref:Septation protein SpoVG family protein n=1 Tax=candidate division TA06 bacterium TaxID=2250710 RepID=A0A933IEA6_UNCT6|nr:septation protein SpoVG family protein [candidate division TA06 bacterium]
MKITEIKVSLRQKDNGKLLAFANVTFDNAFAVRGIKIIQGINGPFIAMPSRKMTDGTYKDIAHPINAETRLMLEKSILDEYHKALKDGGSKPAETEIPSEEK